jgi:hypothetical protein
MDNKNIIKARTPSPRIKEKDKNSEYPRNKLDCFFPNKIIIEEPTRKKEEI